MLRTAGIEIFGYVHTQYGQRDKDVVNSEIKAFSEWYAVDGIFLDEGSSEHHIVSYYNNLKTYIKEIQIPDSPRMRSVILNTGVQPHESYYDVCDNLVTCENYWKDFQSAHIAGLREKSLALLHTCPTAKEMTKAVKKAAASEFVGIFVTDLGMPNPWCALPAYWDEEVDFIASLSKPK